jgi:hypothetical protein
MMNKLKSKDQEKDEELKQLKTKHTKALKEKKKSPEKQVTRDVHQEESFKRLVYENEQL